MRALVVDDDRGVRDALSRVLALGGYEVQSADGGMRAIELVAERPPDVVLLDVGMPDIDGIEVCRRLRRLDGRVPILILTAHPAIDERVDGLDAGADDYMLKPFDVRELEARLRALLRRNDPRSERFSLSFAEIRLDVAGCRAIVGQRVVELTRTEHDLLALFLLNAGTVLSHAEIFDRVWERESDGGSAVLRVYIGYLRRKLRSAGARSLIQTVHGVGYVLREP